MALAERQRHAARADEDKSENAQPQALRGDVVRIAEEHAQCDRGRGCDGRADSDRDERVDHAQMKGRAVQALAVEREDRDEKKHEGPGPGGGGTERAGPDVSAEGRRGEHRRVRGQRELRPGTARLAGPGQRKRLNSGQLERLDAFQFDLGGLGAVTWPIASPRQGRAYRPDGGEHPDLR